MRVIYPGTDRVKKNIPDELAEKFRAGGWVEAPEPEADADVEDAEADEDDESSDDES